MGTSMEPCKRCGALFLPSRPGAVCSLCRRDAQFVRRARARAFAENERTESDRLAEGFATWNQSGDYA